MICSHCGFEHPDARGTCPRTGESLATPGLVGTRVDRYEVLKLLGAGGFGAVYRAKHVHTDAEVALKVLKKQLNADPAMVDRFLREAKAAAAVGSDYIVRVSDAGVATDGTAFLVMELLEGWDLKELINREGAQNPQRLVALMAQVLEGLRAAHSKDIVHRDMKPANVFVVQRDGRDVVKLLDFGISKMHATTTTDLAGLTVSGVAMGTPAYMAPEQFFDARNVDGRADLYSVAVMLYELLGRRLPFEAQSYAELVVKVRTEVPPALSTIAPTLPAALAAAVDKGLARERDARWATAAEFASALTRTTGLPMLATTAPMRAPSTDASLMFGKTATPTPAQPLSRSTPQLSGSGWVATTPPSVATTPQPAVLAAPPAAAAPAAAPVPKKSNAGRTFLIALALVLGFTFLCCVTSMIAKAANPRAFEDNNESRSNQRR